MMAGNDSSRIVLLHTHLCGSSSALVLSFPFCHDLARDACFDRRRMLRPFLRRDFIFELDPLLHC